ncbi:aminoglycoside phosphotransferase family protein [Pontibacter brevis]
MATGNRAAYNLSFIASQFATRGEAADIKPHGSGYIHDTYHVVNAQAASPDYLLQRINHLVFKNVPALMENIQLVTGHLRKKLEDVPGANPEKEVLRLIPLKDNRLFYQDTAGNYWRMYEFLPHTRSYDIVRTAQQAFEGGKAFGTFQALLSDLEANLLHDTIPDFHNIAYRLRLFREAIVRNTKNRVKDVMNEIAFVEARTEVMATILKLGQAGELPLRITHNDTKFNNVLLNEQDEAQCVIDLDTVMPGYVAYDFGDAIRTTVNTASEDEKDLDKISVDLDLFQAFTSGFLKETAGFLTNTEVRSLAMGCLLLPFIMGLRFLTDYIDGDTYYKINFPEHNIQRSRAQFRLVQKLEEQYDLLQSTIQDIARASKQEAEQSA